MHVRVSVLAECPQSVGHVNVGLQLVQPPSRTTGHAAVAGQDKVVEPEHPAPPFAGDGLVHERVSVLATYPQDVGQDDEGLHELQPPLIIAAHLFPSHFVPDTHDAVAES